MYISIGLSINALSKSSHEDRCLKLVPSKEYVDRHFTNSELSSVLNTK
ncbi:hypothetical protein [Clostridium saccharoperbutylacetonicum]|nr:hypothetical protein [Clostridium saccharoperbutylacetonicum]